MPRSSLWLISTQARYSSSLGDFDALTGTERDGYEMCVGPHESGTVNLNNTKFLDFARSHVLRVAGSSF